MAYSKTSKIGALRIQLWGGSTFLLTLQTSESIHRNSSRRILKIWFLNRYRTWYNSIGHIVMSSFWGFVRIETCWRIKIKQFSDPVFHHKLLSSIITKHDTGNVVGNGWIWLKIIEFRFLKPKMDEMRWMRGDHYNWVPGTYYMVRN